MMVEDEHVDMIHRQSPPSHSTPYNLHATSTSLLLHIYFHCCGLTSTATVAGSILEHQTCLIPS